MSTTNFDREDPRLTAYALGELTGDARAEVEALLARDAEARQFVDGLVEMARALEVEYAPADDDAVLLDAQRSRVLTPPVRPRRRGLRIAVWSSVAACAVAMTMAGVYFGKARSWPKPARQVAQDARTAGNADAGGEAELQRALRDQLGYSGAGDAVQTPRAESPSSQEHQLPQRGQDGEEPVAPQSEDVEEEGVTSGAPPEAVIGVASPTDVVQRLEETKNRAAGAGGEGGNLGGPGGGKLQSGSQSPGPMTAGRGGSGPTTPGSGAGPATPGGGGRGPTSPGPGGPATPGGGPRAPGGGGAKPGGLHLWEAKKSKDATDAERYDFGVEGYADTAENPFRRVADDARSTFSIDVDTASYSNARRYLLQQGALPPASSVRIEEFINYFTYDYPQPDQGEPFSVTTEVARCPWAPSHRLAVVGIAGRQVAADQRKAVNLVFLIDVSGSMNDPQKLPLLVRSMRLLVEQLDERDRIAIVVYAGSSGLVLPSTGGHEQGTILATLDRLSAGGSTNGGAGIELAYRVAEDNRIVGGVNRVILCTDGDFNVGITDRGALTRLIEQKRETGVFLSVLGFGSGNLKDDTMEQLADKGNGNYAYIDSIAEARRVLVEQVGGTLEVIAKDVKIQVEFNPGSVEAWRLIGYENRVLAHADFNDDKKDAGEVGAGIAVTALYEIVPKGAAVGGPGVDPSRYQTDPQATGAHAEELLFLRLRYKEPDGVTSKLIEVPVADRDRDFRAASPNLRFAASVAGFAMLLKQSQLAGDLSLDVVRALAQESLGADPGGYRRELLTLIDAARQLRPR